MASIINIQDTLLMCVTYRNLYLLFGWKTLITPLPNGHRLRYTIRGKQQHVSHYNCIEKYIYTILIISTYVSISDVNVFTDVAYIHSLFCAKYLAYRIGICTKRLDRPACVLNFVIDFSLFKLITSTIIFYNKSCS
jgi:hypothetical protein